VGERNLTYEQIRKKGIEVLAKNLGPVDMIRFLQQFDLGAGDYSKERHNWLDGLTVQDIIEDIKRSQG